MPMPGSPKNMTRNEILAFLNDHRDFAIATLDDGKPRVRTLWLHKADETGIYFMAGKLKDVYRQLSVNPQAELCFHSEKMQIRIQGIVENLDKDIELKQEILAARAFLHEWIEQKGLKYMAVFRIVNGTAIIWRQETEMEPSEVITL